MCICGATKNHAKGMCKPCYRSSDYYKELRKSSDKKYQAENKPLIYETRKKRRTSEKYLESESYAKNLIASYDGIPMTVLSLYPDFIKTKVIELKLKRLIKKIKQDGKQEIYQAE